MADAQLNVRIASQEIRVDDPKNSRLSVDIRNEAAAEVIFALYLTIPMALVAAAAADHFVFAGLEANKDASQPPNATRWQLGSKRGTPIKSGTAITITLSNITAASAGVYTIEIEWRRGAEAAGTASLPVYVLAANDVPKIVSFKAKSYVVTWSPGAKSPVKLAWETDKDSVIELWRLGTRLLPDSGEMSAPRTMPEWNDRDYDSSGIQPYELKATAAGRTVSRWLFVRIQEPGWNRIECRQGAPALLLNDADRTLYGIFAHDGEAAVYRLEMEEGGPGRQDGFCCKVPEGMELSPGVFFHNRIWLAGGSQIDPEVCSNKVWCFDPVSNQSGVLEQPASSAMWSPRMGHACTTFDGKIWILGGMDENGNTLSDMWYFDGAGWHQSAPLKTPLCLLAATEFDGRLWVYGGLDAPFGTPQRSLWYLGKHAQDWQRMRFRGRIGKEAGEDPHFGDPFASALCVGQTQGGPVLCALGTFQSDRAIRSALFEVSGYGAADEADVFDVAYAITPDKGWPTKRNAAALQQPFRLSAVGYKGFIFVVSLVSGAETRSLSYLVRA